MFKIHTKIGILLALIFAFSSVHADEISGKLEFSAVGSFVDVTDPVNTFPMAAVDLPVDGDVVGFDFDNPAGLENPSARLTVLTGDIFAMISAAQGPIDTASISATDFDLRSLPATIIQWVISPAMYLGNLGSLIFEILSGQAVDVTGTGVFDDLEGSGRFIFVDDDAQVANIIFTNPGQWSISNSGSSDSIVGINVPAPATLGIFGLGLLGFGVLRRRKST